VYIPETTSAAEPEAERVEPPRRLAISEEVFVFEDIEVDALTNAREEAPREVETVAAPPVIDQPASPFPHQIYGFIGSEQSMPAMMTVPRMQVPGYWMFHPQFGWVQCVYQ
jgi:hypothetical protein